MDFSNYKDLSPKRLYNEATRTEYPTLFRFAAPLFSNDVPVIIILHLSVLVGYKKEYLKKAALHTKYFLP
jgi:RNA-directed DNA polymerase